jgi:hypothetical protein
MPLLKEPDQIKIDRGAINIRLLTEPNNFVTSNPLLELKRFYKIRE